MSRCLNESRIRAVADNEATRGEREHIETCAGCQARVGAARRIVDELTAMSATVTPPASMAERIAAALPPGRAGGATTLREAAPFRPGWRVWVPAGLAAAAVLLVVFALPPLDAPRSISAAEILDRSLQTLAPASGVELREFDLDLHLPPVAAAHNGTYRIEQLVDYDVPGRYRALRYGPDGTLLGGIGDDPASRRRTIFVDVDGQPFVFRLATASSGTVALPDFARQHVQALVRLLQATAGQTVREIERDGAKRYVIELPPVAAEANASGLWELSRGRAVVDAASFQILELTAAGSYLHDTFSVAFRLRNRQVWSSGEVPAGAFEVPGAANAIAIEGAAGEDVGRDLLAAALRELARSRR